MARQAELSSLLLEVCNLAVSLLGEQNSECANVIHATITSCPVSVLKADVIETNKALSWLGVTFIQQQAQQRINSLVLGVTHLWWWWECDNLSTNEVTERVMLLHHLQYQVLSPAAEREVGLQFLLSDHLPLCFGQKTAKWELCILSLKSQPYLFWEPHVHKLSVCIPSCIPM